MIFKKKSYYRWGIFGKNVFRGKISLKTPFSKFVALLEKEIVESTGLTHKHVYMADPVDLNS